MAARALLGWLAVAIALSVGAAQAANPAANPLLTDRGKFRPLIIVTGSALDEEYQRLLESIKRQHAPFEERRMLLYRIEDGHGWRAGKPMTEFETRALLEALELDAQGALRVVLLGLDSGKKMQLEGYIDPRQIFQTIDNMPMRQAEMQHPGKTQQ